MLRPFGARVPKNRSRAVPFVRFFSTTFLRLLKLLRSFSIATAKTSYTTFTLCDIFAEIYKKIKRLIIKGKFKENDCFCKFILTKN
jgi:hypothetical protein